MKEVCLNGVVRIPNRPFRWHNLTSAGAYAATGRKHSSFTGDTHRRDVGQVSSGEKTSRYDPDQSSLVQLVPLTNDSHVFTATGLHFLRPSRKTSTRNKGPSQLSGESDARQVHCRGFVKRGKKLKTH